MHRSSEVVVVGPLSEVVAGFAEYSRGLGYAESSIELRLRLLAHLSRWIRDEGLSLCEIDGPVVERFLIVRRATHTGLIGARALAPLLEYLRSLGMLPPVVTVEPAPGSVDEVVQRWAEYLVSVRGLRAGTVRYYRGLGRPLLQSRVVDGVLDLSGLTAAQVSAFVSARIPGLPVGTGKLTITALRSLLRFLHVSGLVAQRLEGAVPGRAGYRDSGLPRGLAADRVASVIAACDPATPIGRRDRAIVLILARLGLRAAEVSRICLDDIDWRGGTIRVTGKGGYVDLVPLPADVGDALAAYLLDPRPAAASGRSLFVGSLAPYRTLSPAAVIAVVHGAGERSGFPGLGSHRLRHSVAAATINAGASLEETAQLLRHRSLTSTMIYAKVDLARLGEIARPWPVIPDAVAASSLGGGQ